MILYCLAKSLKMNTSNSSFNLLKINFISIEFISVLHEPLQINLKSVKIPVTDPENCIEL